MAIRGCARNVRRFTQDETGGRRQKKTANSGMTITKGRVNMYIDDLPWKNKKELKVYEYELPDKLYVSQWIVPAGTRIKMMVTRNFGWVVLPKDCQDYRGFTIPKRIFKW
jgi:hypothetical protein